MRRAFLLLAVLISGCGERTSANAYRDWRDRVAASVGVPLFGWGPCGRALRDDKFEPDKSIFEICYRLTQPQRWHGSWRNDFEGSRFCPAPATQCSHDTPGEKISLQYSFGITDTSPSEWKVPPGGLYEVEFIGRRTAVKGHYGHMGASDHAMIVDRMISVREVEPPPKK
jgi:hypothetical protein